MPTKGTRLLEALARLWISFWGRRASVAVKTEPDRKDRGWTEARRRFWAEFREGQREAEAHSSRPR